MFSLLETPIGRFRVIAFIEGISFLLLLGVAMPLKYLAGMPEYVSVVGMAHGILWILFVGGLWDVRTRYRWSLTRTLWGLFSSVVPFGTFVLDIQLRQEEALARAATTR